MRSKKYSDLYQKTEGKAQKPAAERPVTNRPAEPAHKPKPEVNSKPNLDSKPEVNSKSNLDSKPEAKPAGPVPIAEAKPVSPAKKKKKKWPKVLAVVLILLIAGAGGAYAYARHFMNKKLNQVHRVKVDKNKLSIVDVKGYVNIALLGVDSRGMNKKNLKNSNTDCIIIVSMNTKTKKVNLISVYRDTYLRINGTSTYEKVNSAFPTTGINGCLNTLNQAMDLDIDSYVLFNFKMVSDLVNQVGGITVNVHQNEIYQLNKYTRQTARNVGQKKYKLVKKAGRQKLEGVQAVSYGRIRKGVGDDFKRTSRMRLVIKLVLDKLKHSSFSELSDIMDVCLKQCQTNLSNNDMIGLAQRLSGLEIQKSVGWPYNVTTGFLGQVSYVFPVNLEANTKRLHREMFGQKNYQVSTRVKTQSDAIASAVASGTSMYSVNTSRSTYTPYRGSTSTSRSQTYTPRRSYSGGTGSAAGSAAGTGGAASAGAGTSSQGTSGNAGAGAAGGASAAGQTAGESTGAAEGE